MRPMLEVVDVADIFSGAAGKRKYTQQTVSGTFITVLFVCLLLLLLFFVTRILLLLFCLVRPLS